MTKVGVSLLLSLFTASAMATPVTYAFTGTAWYVSGMFAGRGTTAVTGTFSFDDGLVDGSPGTPSIDYFLSTLPASNAAITDAFRATLTIGDLTVSHSSGSLNGGSPASLLLEDQADCGGVCGDDSITFTMLPTGASNQFFQLVADDPSATALGIGPAHLTNTIAGAVSILDSLDLNRYELRSATQTSSWVGPGGDSDKIYFTWTGVQRAPVVPIPSPLFLLVSGLLGLVVATHHERASVHRK